MPDDVSKYHIFKAKNDYRKVASNNARNSTFRQIRVENHLHKQSETAYMCFKMRRTSTRDFSVNKILVLFSRSLKPPERGQWVRNWEF